MAKLEELDFEVLNNSEAAACHEQAVDLEVEDDVFGTKMNEPIVEDGCSQGEAAEMEEDGWFVPLMPKKVLGQVTEMNAHHSKVQWGSLAMRYIESEGKGRKVPKKQIQSEADDEQRALWEIVYTSICTINDRVNSLEEELKTLKKGASSSSSSAAEGQPIPVDEDWKTVAVDWSYQPAKKKKTVQASVEFYKLPKWNPWSTTAGKCPRCQFAWSNKDTKENGRTNVDMDRSVWETIMHKMYLDWSPEKMINDEECRVLNSYTHTAANITSSLSSFGLVPEHQYDEVDGRLRNRLFQPDCHNDDRCMWLYSGGNKEKYLSFGCIYCQRGTSVNYSATDFQRVIQRFFWT
jgi:hypothetical protein